MRLKAVMVNMNILSLEIFLIFLGARDSDTVEMCRNYGATAGIVTLELSLSRLTLYEGYCTCRINRINQGGNVTMDADIQIDGCDSLYLEVEKWNYQTSCAEEPGYDQTQFLLPGQFYRIFMKKGLGGSSPTIGGSITFRSLNSDKLALACEDAVYGTPPPTTTSSTSGPSQMPTKNIARMCRNSGATYETVTLELSLSNLTHYEGNCTCYINHINQRGDVIMEADIQIDGCDSLYLQVEKWNYQTSCGEESGYDQTQFLGLGQSYKIFLNRSVGELTPTIGGSITFRSVNSDELSLACEDAVYDIPPLPTTTASNPRPSNLSTILAIVGGVLVGLIVLLVTIFLYMRYRKKRRQVHGVEEDQEGVSIPHDTAIMQRRSYETLDRRELGNQGYEDIFSNRNQIQVDVIYENGIVYQEQTSGYELNEAETISMHNRQISAASFDNDIQYLKAQSEVLYENVAIVKNQRSLHENAVIRSDQTSLKEVPYINAAIFSDQTLQKEVSYTNVGNDDDQTRQSACLDNNMQEETQTYVNLH